MALCNDHNWLGLSRLGLRCRSWIQFDAKGEDINGYVVIIYIYDDIWLKLTSGSCLHAWLLRYMDCNVTKWNWIQLAARRYKYVWPSCLYFSVISIDTWFWAIQEMKITQVETITVAMHTHCQVYLISLKQKPGVKIHSGNWWSITWMTSKIIQYRKL